MRLFIYYTIYSKKTILMLHGPPAPVKNLSLRNSMTYKNNILVIQKIYNDEDYDNRLAENRKNPGILVLVIGFYHKLRKKLPGPQS